MKKAICVGINNYPGFANDLQGCVNDANDWSALLRDYGFVTTVILDSQATSGNIKAALQNLIAGAVAGDVIVLTYSGHGTQYLDVSGDEGDRYDEALYVYDGRILDDELRVIIDGMDPAVTLVVISDSCFSGSVTRLVPEKTKPRFVPPDGMSEYRQVRQRFLLPETGMPELLISGCTDSEYSYDAEIDGRANGAMSAMAIRVMRQNPGVTYGEFYAALRALLPSKDYPQTPQLEGAAAHKGTRLFEPFAVVSEPGPTPTPSPTPDPIPTPVPNDSPGCVPGLMRQVSRLFKSD